MMNFVRIDAKEGGLLFTNTSSETRFVTICEGSRWVKFFLLSGEAREIEGITVEAQIEVNSGNARLHDPFLIYTVKEEGHGSVYLWWKPNRCGYTRYIEDAGRYSAAEAMKIVGNNSDSVGAVPLDVVMRHASRVLRIGTLHERLEPGVHGLSASDMVGVAHSIDGGAAT